MTENNPSERELRERFQALRARETDAAPTFSGLVARARRQSSGGFRRRSSLLLIPVSAAALICLTTLFLLTNRESDRPSLFSGFPVLLENHPDEPGLFAGLERPDTEHRFFSDTLLPLHLRINL